MGTGRFDTLYASTTKDYVDYAGVAPVDAPVIDGAACLADDLEHGHVAFTGPFHFQRLGCCSETTGMLHEGDNVQQ